MDDYLSAWDSFARRDFEASRATFEARPDFADLMAEAARRGFRRITLAEQCDTGCVDAYMWRGGVWVRD